MSVEWADRQRRTNRLVRAAAGYVLQKRSVTPEQLYGLCKLTWITNSYDGKNPAYVSSTKIPALGEIFRKDFGKLQLTEIAKVIEQMTANKSIASLTTSETGFTNFYKAYRNTSKRWLRDNFAQVLPIFRSALSMSTDGDGLELARRIQTLPGIPKANHKAVLMKAEYLMTPVMFALDSRVRFPLINGNEGVQGLLKKLGATHVPLPEQYTRMVGLYGKGGIKDAADLDQTGGKLPDFIAIQGGIANRKLFTKQLTAGKSLPLKDEADIKVIQKAGSYLRRKLHNEMTNDLSELLGRYTVTEGSQGAQYDVLISNYDNKGSELLVEVKSSCDAADIRMAIGQVLDYWFRLKGNQSKHVAILLPQCPSDESQALLDWLGIDLLWMSEGKLRTRSKRLAYIADVQ